MGGLCPRQHLVRSLGLPGSWAWGRAWKHGAMAVISLLLWVFLSVLPIGQMGSSALTTEISKNVWH